VRSAIVATCTVRSWRISGGARLHDVAKSLGVLGKNGLHGWHSHTRAGSEP